MAAPGQCGPSRLKNKNKQLFCKVSDVHPEMSTCGGLLIVESPELLRIISSFFSMLIPFVPVVVIGHDVEQKSFASRPLVGLHALDQLPDEVHVHSV